MSLVALPDPAPVETVTPEALNARVLDAIRASALDQFTNALAWAQWTHALSMAAGDGDLATVDAMTNPPETPAE